MHHRASRPLLDLPHHLSRATARSIGSALHSRSGRMLIAVSAVLSLGPAGYAALGPVAARTVQRHAAATPGISGGLRDVEVLTRIAREGDRVADLLRAGSGASTAPSASPTPSSPPPAEDTLAPATATPSAAPAPRPRPSHAPSSGPIPRPRHSPAPTPPPTPGPTPAGPSARRDTTTPSTRLVVRLATRNAATFLLSADEPASFACSLDGAAYVPCSSPAVFTNLTSGWHTFAVRAIDVAGNADPTPAQARWHASGGH
jgi:hypothetical protein